MEIRALRKDVLNHKTDCLIIGRFEGREGTELVEDINKALGGVLSNAIKSGDFKGELNQIAMFYSAGNISAKRVLMVGLGKKKEFTLDKLRQASGTAMGALKQKRASSLSTTLPQSVNGIFSCEEAGQVIAEGSLLAQYDFSEHKTKKKEKPKPIKTLNLVMALRQKGIKELEKGAQKGARIAEAVSVARNLISQPANVATPSHLAAIAAERSKELGFKATVLEKKDMEKLKMGALLGVAQGSSEPPKFIVLEYFKGKKEAKPFVIVGKGVTFDSGGISIKPSPGMEEMKTDMSGGAAAIATVIAAASLKLPLNLVALIPATENLPGSKAYKPGDILTSMSGQTIEVLNTDAEGRLIMADALTYAERYEPEAVIDIATLTGACVVALGSHATGLLGNNEGLKKQLLKAGEETGERLWELPLWDSYKEQIKSDVADMKNIGGKEAGTITAAALLDKFATKYHWAHLDIAGTAWDSKGAPYSPKGAVGAGVRLLVRFLEDRLSD
ncbi:MAG: leucyl aminopeptidase [Proteobacteria bacterium]|nr:leucyl aminopeptidase [Pseudomonadota bacterium]